MKSPHDALEKRIRAMHPLDFEEFCAQLIVELGFVNVRRQGGGSQFGRDIAADYPARKLESWHFECKKYSRRITVKEIAGKLLWAGTDSVLDYFVLVSNADVSNDVVEVLRRLADRRYQVRLWTGNTFRRLLSACPSTVSAYFHGLAIPEHTAVEDFMKAQRGRRSAVERPTGTSGGESISVTIQRAPRTPGENPCYAVLVDAEGNELAHVTLKRGQKITLHLPKGLLGKPVRVVYDFDPHACLARHYPDEENILLAREMALPSEHLRQRISAVARVPWERWRKYTGRFYRDPVEDSSATPTASPAG